MLFYRNTIVGLLANWILDWAKAKITKRNEAPKPQIGSPEFKDDLKKAMLASFEPSNVYRHWLRGEWDSYNYHPDMQLTVKTSEKTIDEIMQIFYTGEPYEHPLMFHTGHEDKDCPGEPLAEGLRKIFSNQPSGWKIRRAEPGATYSSKGDSNIGTLKFFLAQEFEGSEPGNPNRDICDLALDRCFAPMELELKIPHHAIITGDLVGMKYLKINLKIDPVIGVVATGYEEGETIRPRGGTADGDEMPESESCATEQKDNVAEAKDAADSPKSNTEPRP